MPHARSATVAAAVLDCHLCALLLHSQLHVLPRCWAVDRYWAYRLTAQACKCALPPPLLLQLLNAVMQVHAAVVAVLGLRKCIPAGASVVDHCKCAWLLLLLLCLHFACAHCHRRCSCWVTLLSHRLSYLAIPASAAV
jgi:hypothetical protein